jgi:putative ABC transport system permease protein
MSASTLPVLAYSVGLVILTTLLFGLAPAILTARRDLNDVLKQAARGAGGSSGQRLRGMLVSAEVALAMVLVTSAALMIASVAKLSRVPLGFDPAGVITMRVPLRGQVYRNNPQRVAAVLTELVRRTNTLPGVVHASITRGVPGDGWNGEDFVTAENPDPPPGQSPDGNYVVVSPPYFDLMRIPVLRGRAFLESDVQNSTPVAIVNDELVREFWPNADPLGKRLRSVPVPPNAPWLTVVGVAGNVATQGPTNTAHPEVFVPLAQYPWAITPRELLVRTSPGVNTGAIVDGIRKQLRALDPAQPVSDVRPLESAMDEHLSVQRFLMWLLTAFGALSLLLAGLGVYGVLSYAVSLRTQEIGIRMALGAERGDVLTQIILRGVALGFAGIAVGAAGALSLTGFLRSQLYQTGPHDPATFVLVPAVLLIVTLSASYIPARRATAVEPMTALRCE